MNSTRLQLSKPGSPWGWHDHFVVGNGRLGAALSGRADVETVRLNEQTIWSRWTDDGHSDAARESLAEIRQLLLEGKTAEAEFLAEAKMTGPVNRIQPYEPLAALSIGYARPSRSMAAGVTDYTRWLDLEEGVAGVSFVSEGKTYRRELFASHPDQVMVLRLTTDDPAGHDLWLKFHRQANYAVQADGDTLTVRGRAGEHGTRFIGRVRVVPDSGRVESAGARLVVSGSRSVCLLITAETDYWEGFRGRAVDVPYAERSLSRLDAAAAKGYDALRTEHVADFRALMERVSFNLGSPEIAVDVEDEIAAAGEGTLGSDFHVAQQRMSRYINVSSSRGDGLPSNLQGLWNDRLTPAWNSDYHTNINIQMNYWPAESGALGECHRPFLDWLGFVAESGRLTAKHHYGCRGWVLHHLSDPWGFTLPADAASDGLWPVGGAWCCLHLWEHYQHQGDQEWLGQYAYPLMRDAALFFEDFCFDGEDGLLHTGPSTSPENLYRTAAGAIGKLCVSPTMDHQIIRELLRACIASAKVLGIDEDRRDAWEGMLNKLRPTRVGPNGTIAEWSEDYEEIEPGHRHMSHLFGLFPGTQITADGTPDLAEAARKTIDRRLGHQEGGDDVGWSAAWKACFFARLYDGERALESLRLHAQRCTLPNGFGAAHNHLQFDSAAGMGAAVTEMLVQSHDVHDGVRLVRLLPALPADWPVGQLRGVVVRGGHRLGFAWQGGVVTSAQITIGFETELTLVSPLGSAAVKGKPGDRVVIDVAALA
ncbi:MAG: glycoside hydrolase family 95 protein [Planctomycetota bacterium]